MKSLILALGIVAATLGFVGTASAYHPGHGGYNGHANYHGSYYGGHPSHCGPHGCYAPEPYYRPYGYPVYAQPSYGYSIYYAQPRVAVGVVIR